MQFLKAPAWIPTWFLLATVGGFLVGCSKGVSAEERDATSSSRPIPVRTITLSKPTVEPVTRQFTGVLKARRTVAVGTQVAGFVTEVTVKEGQWVESGSVLVRLDTRRLTSAKVSLAAQHSAAQATLDQLNAGPRKEAIRAAKASVSALNSDLALAKLQLERRKLLLESDSASQEEVDAGEAQVTTMEARLAGLQANLEELENGTRPELIANQEAVIEGIVAEEKRVQLDILDSEVQAPFAGWVQEIRVRKGAVISAGHGVILLVEGGPLEAHFGLPIKESKRVQASEPKLSSSGTPLTILATRSLPLVDPVHRTQTWIFEVESGAPGRPIPLLSGASARMTLQYPLAEPGWRIPLSAITEGVRGMWAGYLVTENKNGEPVLQAVDLEVLHTGKHHCVVRGALKEGDRLLSDGLDRVIAGQVVSLSEAPSEAAEETQGD